MRPKGEISLNKVYRCKLCGEEFTSIPVYWSPFGEYVVSGKTLLKHHLITRHGKRSLKKKYFEKVKLD